MDETAKEILGDVPKFNRWRKEVPDESSTLALYQNLMRPPKHGGFAESVLLAARRNLRQTVLTVKFLKQLWRNFQDYFRVFFLRTPAQHSKIRISEVIEVSPFLRRCFSLSSCPGDDLEGQFTY